MPKDGFATLYLFDKNSVEFHMGKAARALGMIIALPVTYLLRVYYRRLIAPAMDGENCP